MEEHNCHPMKSISLALIQIPVWICFSSALRNIVFGLPLPRTEGKCFLNSLLCILFVFIRIILISICV